MANNNKDDNSKKGMGSEEYDEKTAEDARRKGGQHSHDNDKDNNDQ